MLDIKNNKLLVFLLLLVAANIINLFIGRQTTLEYKMQQALENHEHENALIIASNLLKKEPRNQEAINIIKQSGQILLYLQLAQTEFPHIKVVKNQETGQLSFYQYDTAFSEAELENPTNNVIVEVEEVYQYFNSAKAYIAKAKALDAKFKTTFNFEKKLDKAQHYVLDILVAKVLDEGKNVYSKVSQNYQKKSAIINSASNSKYLNKLLTIQSAFSPVEISLANIEQTINPLLNKMDDTSRLVSEYNSGKLTHSLLAYIKIVRNSVDIFLLPKGSYKDFAEVASHTSDEYKQAYKKLKLALAESAKLNNFSVLLKAFTDYQLFNHSETVDIIKKNQYLQDA